MKMEISHVEHLATRQIGLMEELILFTERADIPKVLTTT